MNLKPLVNKIVYEWAAKCQNGFPDVSNPADLAKLIPILKSNVKNITINEVQTAFRFLIESGQFLGLELSKLKQRPNRLEKLISKISSGDEIELVDGSKEKFDGIEIDGQKFDLSSLKEVSVVDKIKQLVLTGSAKVMKLFNKKTSIPVSRVAKTSEFGGKGIGNAIGMNIEDEVLGGLMKQIEENGGSVNIKVGNKIYKDISASSKPTGSPKADFILSNGAGKGMIFISHKDGKGPFDFQQYGGFTDAGDSKDFKKFIDKLKSIVGIGLSSGESFQRVVRDDEVSLRSIYGKSFGEVYGLNNCQVLLQGPIKLVKIKDGLFKLESNHTITTPEIPEGAYYPYYYASYRKGMNQLGIKDCRIMILRKRNSAKQI